MCTENHICFGRIHGQYTCTMAIPCCVVRTNGLLETQRYVDQGSGKTTPGLAAEAYAAVKAANTVMTSMLTTPPADDNPLRDLVLVFLVVFEKCTHTNGARVCVLPLVVEYVPSYVHVYHWHIYVLRYW